MPGARSGCVGIPLRWLRRSRPVARAARAESGECERAESRSEAEGVVSPAGRNSGSVADRCRQTPLQGQETFSLRLYTLLIRAFSLLLSCPCTPKTQRALRSFVSQDTGHGPRGVTTPKPNPPTGTYTDATANIAQSASWEAEVTSSSWPRPADRCKASS